ncbi:MAG TPA: reductive dehalogenase domain-containing protein [Spirochaetia bacterium]|nr:reductive dehalogenase domain-containing protein [Spirochaetia bacterium]
MDLAEKCVEAAKEKGADLVGIAPVDSFSADPAEAAHPRFFMDDAKAVVVCGLKLVDALWDKLTGTRDVHSLNLRSYLLHYNYDLLDFIGVQTARFLESQGYEAYPVQARTESRSNNVMTGYFPFKEAAVKAGLGLVGRHSMVNTPEFGPRQRLVAVITNAPLVPNRYLGEEEKARLSCGDCTNCIDRCPVGAISVDPATGAPVVDRPKCQAQLDFCQCALCQGVCPFGRKGSASRRRSLGA